MELFIDNCQADMDQGAGVSISVSVASVTQPEYGRTGYTKRIALLMTARNREIMGDCEQINALKRFNAEMHEARIEHDGCIIMEGYIMLTACEKYDCGGRYVFNIIGSGKKWSVHASRNGLSSLFPDYAITLNAGSIASSWSSSVPVRWLPVLRNRYEPENSSVGLAPAERVLSASDYHPFIHLRSVVHEIFAEAGYTLSSDFIDSTYFDSFYMSGRYTSTDVSVLRQRMDFLASRFGEVSATADGSGRVYADPFTPYNSIGNFVDTANPKEEQNGVTLDGVFTNGGCFRKEGLRVAFVPQQRVTMGFEYKLRYVTGYRIVNRSKLAGFDKIYLGNSHLHEFTITNRFKDRRGEFRGGKEFRCIVCDYASGYNYRLLVDRITNPNADPDNLGPTDYVPVTLAQFSVRSVVVSTTQIATYFNLRLLRAPVGGNYVPYTGEWALYDGYVSETGETEVEVVVRSAAEIITPGSPKYFSSIYFAGAQVGMSFKLKRAEIRPVFQPQPTVGTTLRFSDIAAHGVNRMTVIDALRGMFGLCFYADELEKRVYVEPRERFYRSDVVVDWSDRIDYSRPYVLGDLATEVPATLTWRYRGGDGASASFNVANGGEFGCWSTTIDNPWKEDQERNYENVFFTTSVNSEGVLASSLSASLVNVGDIHAQADAYADDLNFPAKVVRYMGLKRLPDGERWGWPGFANSYPLLAFHYPFALTGITPPTSPAGGGNSIEKESALGYSLCYEERDGATGVHRWWDSLVDTYNNSRRLEVWMKLGPEDIEVLLRPNHLLHDFRAVFRLFIEGEWSDWRLEEIDGYNPAMPSTKCIFIKIV